MALFQRIGAVGLLLDESIEMNIALTAMQVRATPAAGRL